VTWGPYAVLSALVGGIALGERLGPSPATGAMAAAVLLVVAAVASRGPRARMPLLLTAALLLGCALSQRALNGLEHSPLSAAIEARADVTVEAALAEDPDGTRFTSSALARVHRFRLEDGPWRDAGGRTVLVSASGDAAPRIGVLGAGDRIVVRGWLRPLDAYDERLRWRHAVADLEATDLLAFRPPGGVLVPVANALRTAVLGGTASLPSTERALLAGFLLGDTRALPDEVLDHFRSAGLSHLLAVSGANLAFVLALLGPALRRLSRTPRLVATLFALLLFGAMTRWEPSVLRACAMATCAVVAVHAGRPARAVRTLAIAATILVAADPFLVHSVGFLLSCSASLGIAVLGPAFAARLRGPEWLRESLATTASAQVGVAPVLLPVFGSIPLVALPANLLAVPLAGPLTAWGLAAGGVGGLLASPAPLVSRVLQLPTQVLAEAVLGIADAASRVPVAVDLRTTVALALAGGLIALTRLPRRLRRHAPVAPPR